MSEAAMVSHVTAEALIVPVHQNDIVAMNSRVRPADRVEFERHMGRAFVDVLEQSLDSAVEAWSGFIDGDLAGIFGLSVWDDSTPTRVVGFPWLCTTSVVERYPLLFHRTARMVVNHWRGICNGGMFIEVDHEYDTALRWVRRFGFRPLAEQPRAGFVTMSWPGGA